MSPSRAAQRLWAESEPGLDCPICSPKNPKPTWKRKLYLRPIPKSKMQFNKNVSRRLSCFQTAVSDVVGLPPGYLLENFDSRQG